MNWKEQFPKQYRYFETKNGILYNIDNLKILKQLSKECVDLVLTDPPYGIGADKGVGRYGKCKSKKYNDNWDNTRPNKKIFDIILKISKNSMIFGGNYFADLLPIGTHWIFWDKKGEIKFKNPYSDGELIWTSFNYKRIKKYVFIQQGFITQQKEKRYHPTQKPLKLIENLLKDYSDKDNIILDPFAGSGTILLAAERLNRRWIGIEIEQKYCEIIKRRLNDFKKTIFKTKSLF